LAILDQRRVSSAKTKSEWRSEDRVRRASTETQGVIFVTSAEKYVTAAYLVALAVVVLYVVLYAFKLARLEREIAELPRLGSEPGEDEEARARPVP
jgi:hypothetical protein